jgi:hypothetical protein
MALSPNNRVIKVMFYTHSMTDEKLKDLACQVATMATVELSVRHELNGVMAEYWQGIGLRRMKALEKTAIEMYGKDWLNSGRAKQFIFGLLCATVGVMPPDAVVISTGINDYEVTPAFLALREDERRRIFEERIARNYPQYFVPRRALMVTAQTPERVCLYRQRLQNGLLIGEPEIDFVPQSEFKGRLKVFGADPPPEIAKAFEDWLKEHGHGGS